MKALSAQALAQKALDGVNVVWMVDAAFDEFGLATEYRRYGSRAYTIGVYTYSDLLAEDGLDITESSVAERGGLASVGSFTVKVRDEEDESALVDDYVVINDPVVVTQVFVNGSEVLGDRFELMRGVIERHRTQTGEWILSVKDDSLSLLKDFPQETLSPSRYPFAYDPGQVLPVPFGNLNHGPDDGDGLSAVLAPVKITDKYEVMGTAGYRAKTQGAVYQWYEEAGQLALVPNATPGAGGLVDVSDPERELVLRPIRPVLTNNVAGWWEAVDGNTSTSVTITTVDDLDVYLSGSSKLGRMVAIELRIVAAGDYTLSVYDDTTLRNGPSALSGNQTVALTLGDWSAWELAYLNVQIDGPGSGSTTISDIKVVITFDDFASTGTRAPALWQAVVGYEDQAANYADGGVVVGAGTALRNPVHQLEAVLRDSNMVALEEAKIMSGWSAAVTSRTSWLFDWFLASVQGEGFLNDFCFQAGLHLFPEEGGFSVAAMDKSRAPQHFFSGHWHMPAINGTGPDASTWQDDFEVRPVDASEIINEFSLRYRMHGPSGAFRAAHTASGQYRLTSTCTLTTAGVLEDLAASFQTDDVRAGERIYIAGDIDYVVDADASSQTQLQVSPADGSYCSTITVPKAYYLGPDVDGVMVVSQLSYKRVQALGVRQVTYLDDGGFKSPFIVDDDTAELLVEHVKEWFAFPRDFVSFPVHHTGVNLQLGDVLMLNHDKLKASKQPVAMTTLDGNHSSAVTTLTVAIGTAGLFRVDDWVLLESPTTTRPEVVQVTAVDIGASTIDVTRAMLGTEAMALLDGWVLSRVTTKWMVIGLRPMTPADPVIRVRAVQMPNSYRPIGRVVVSGYPVASAATPAELAQAGWAVLRNGRIWDLDPDSAISYVGPDSGTYTIV